MYIILCHTCGEEIECEVSEQELYAEFRDNHPEETAETCIMCDDCFNSLPCDEVTIH